MIIFTCCCIGYCTLVKVLSYCTFVCVSFKSVWLSESQITCVGNVQLSDDPSILCGKLFIFYEFSPSHHQIYSFLDYDDFVVLLCTSVFRSRFYLCCTFIAAQPNFNRKWNSFRERVYDNCESDTKFELCRLPQCISPSTYYTTSVAVYCVCETFAFHIG